MFTCHPIRNGESYLSKHLTANDYYSEKEHVTGQWIGQGAERLGLVGKEIGAKDAAFEALRTNRHPETGETLTGRDAPERIAFYDFQCSAPKSVSIAAVTFGDERLVAAHREAVAVAFGELERYAARRDRKGDKAGRDEHALTGNVVAAAFNHDASRELDAQLHTHLVCANATYDEKEGKWYALYNRRMFEAVGFAGRVYQAELAKRVQALGYSVREDRENGQVKGFEIEGVTAADCEKQSTRRAQIEAEIEKFRAEHGRRPTTGEIHVIATETRQKKLAEITTPEVRALQRAKYAPADQARLGELVATARLSAGREGVSKAMDLSSVLLNAAEHLLERKAVVTQRDVLTIALRENVGRVTLGELRTVLARERSVMKLTAAGDGPPDEVRVTSAAQLARERTSIALVNTQAGKFAPLDRGAPVEGLGADQERAVREILASKDGVHAMLGRAGAGKTHTLTVFDRLARTAGESPVYVAPTHAAKEVLQDDGFEAETVSQLLHSLQNGTSTLKGRMLVVDEAGMLSTKQGERLLREASRAKARVLLVGDEKQLTSVEAGDWLGLILRHSRLRASVLSAIRRQKPWQYRAAVTAMSAGKVADGLEIMDRMGWVKEGRGKYLEQAANAWLEKRRAKETAILVAPTWREIDQLNAQVRTELAKSGELTGPESRVEAMDLADFTAAQRRRAKNFEAGMFVNATSHVRGVPRGEWVCVAGTDVEKGMILLANGQKVDAKRFGPQLQVARRLELPVRAGDTLMLQGNNRKLGVINGESVTVLGVGPEGVRVRQERGRKKGREVVLPPSYKMFVHGYAVTAEKSQGATVDHAIVAAEQLDGRRTYVATSRGRRSVEVHVPERAAAKARVPNKIEPLEAAQDHRPPVEDAAEPKSRRAAIGSFVDRQKALLKRIAAHVRSRIGRTARKSVAREHSTHSIEL